VQVRIQDPGDPGFGQTILLVLGGLANAQIADRRPAAFQQERQVERRSGYREVDRDGLCDLGPREALRQQVDQEARPGLERDGVQRDRQPYRDRALVTGRVGYGEAVPVVELVGEARCARDAGFWPRELDLACQVPGAMVMDFEVDQCSRPRQCCGQHYGRRARREATVRPQL
jgi:hypothetical protein